MKTRSQILELAARREYDLAVIGGGILGAGVAQDAASRGLSVLLLEKEDFASGSSGQSSKVLEGGLAYLEKGQLGRARLLANEQALLENLAPHLIREQNFVLPMLGDKPFIALKALASLLLRDRLLAGSAVKRVHKRLGQREVVDAIPALSGDKLSVGWQFSDAITDDARLVIEVIKLAAASGAHAVNYMEAIELEQIHGKEWHVTCRNRYTGKEVVFQAKACINAAGVSSDLVSQLVDPTWSPRFELAQCVRFMLPASAYETNSAFYLLSAEGERIFLIPWQRALLVGIDGVARRRPQNGAIACLQEIEQVLYALNRHNAHRKIERTDVNAAWVQERLLPKDNQRESGDGNLLGSLSRIKSAISNRLRGGFGGLGFANVFEGPKGIVNVVSDNMTSYRLIATEAVNQVLRANPSLTASARGASRTQRAMLGGWLDKQDFLTVTAIISTRARKMYVEPATIDHLIETYGKDAQLVLDFIEEKPYLNQRICPDFPPILAEIPHCIINEMAVSLEDLLCRRIRLAQLHHRQCLEAAPKVARIVQDILSWDGRRVEAEIAALAERLTLLQPQPTLA